MRRTMWVAVGGLALLLATVLSLGGCASATTDPGDSGTSADPADLVGLWRVRDAAEPDRTWLRLDAGEYQLWRDCDGFLDGAWNATTQTLLIGVPFGAAGGCADELTDGAIGWLNDARSYRADADGWELLDADGAVTARLTVDGAPEPITSAASYFAEPPTARPVFVEPAPLPDGLTAPTTDDLIGRWVPPAAYETEPYVELLADTSWTGSDGCNGADGSWVLGEDGLWLATGGPMTLIGCDGAGVPGWLVGTGRVGLDGATLVLLDVTGAEVGRLVRG